MNRASSCILEVECDLELGLDSALAVLGRDARDFNLKAFYKENSITGICSEGDMAGGSANSNDIRGTVMINIAKDISKTPKFVFVAIDRPCCPVMMHPMGRG